MKRTILTAALMTLLVALNSCDVDETSFSFRFESPATADRRLHIDPDCITAIFISRGPTRPYTVLSSLSVLDEESGRYVDAGDTYDMPQGEDITLGRMWECYFTDAPEGRYKAEVSLSRGGETKSATTFFEIKR